MTATVNRQFAYATLFVIAAGLAICIRPIALPTHREASLRTIVAAFHARNDDGLSLALQHLEAFPADPLVVAMTAEFASRKSDTQMAIAYYEKLPKDAGHWEFFANLGLARQYQVLVKLTKVEQCLTRATEISPFNLSACERLGHLLQSEGRVWEASRYFMTQILRGKCRGDELLCVACPERFFREDDRLSFLALRDNDPVTPMQVAAARKHLFENRSDEAEICLRQLLAVHPEIGEAQGRLGRIIVDRGDIGEFLKWRTNLTDASRDHPEVWFVQGLQARQMQQVQGAAACFVRALKQSPRHIAATLQLAQCLEQLGDSSNAQQLAQRGKTLGELDSTLNFFRVSPGPVQIRRAIQLLANLDRHWEAAGWCHVLSHAVDATDHQEVRQARHEMNRFVRLARLNPQAHEVIQTLELDRFTPPQWPLQSLAPSINTTAEHDLRPGDWNFTEEAAQRGIRFQYYEGSTEDTRMQHIINTMGGGLGVIDFDLDGWPDLQLAQGNDWRDTNSKPTQQDRLFRNLDGQSFDDVTQYSSTGDTSFTHGVSVGDFDADGFPDIYLGNLGPNRLYHNNGDGTFDDVTVSAGVAGNEWTTSNVWADFTGDGLPDLYVLNYSNMSETKSKECRQGGVPVACTPDVLTPEVGRLYINQADGSFRDVSDKLDVPLPAGRGLGVIAWDFQRKGRIDLFIANDTMANFLLANHGLDRHGNPQLRDEAVVRGVALDADGNAQASMGVAAGDADGDGQIDLFITTFAGESKTLYSLKKDGFFEDATRRMNLRESGFWMLGFGSQFADFNNDGWSDLVVTNGHVDQKSKRGDSDRMRPQVFANQTGKRFREVPAESLGEFFRGKYLGRGLATLDWNRDGKTDVAVSHLHAPFALLTNRSEAGGETLNIKLIGLQARYPVGATVWVRTPSTQQAEFAVAGDGFLVTNEKTLRFSIPPADKRVEITVRWSDQDSQSWTVERKAEFATIVQGAAQIIWHQPVPEN